MSDAIDAREATDPAGAGDGLAGLRRSLGGAVLAPTDAGFDAARRCFNTLVDRRPGWFDTVTRAGAQNASRLAAGATMPGAAVVTTSVENDRVEWERAMHGLVGDQAQAPDRVPRPAFLPGMLGASMS